MWTIICHEKAKLGMRLYNKEQYRASRRVFPDEVEEFEEKPSLELDDVVVKKPRIARRTSPPIKRTRVFVFELVWSIETISALTEWDVQYIDYAHVVSQGILRGRVILHKRTTLRNLFQLLLSMKIGVISVDYSGRHRIYYTKYSGYEVFQRGNRQKVK